jgi:choline dehydrogenase-like flavoprotein
MNIIDGAELAGSVHESTDVVVVGSGPAGATVARAVARSGARVIVVEEGPFVTPDQFPADSFSAMARMYRGMGAMVGRGKPIMPFVQGRVVGGTSVVNGAISWRLPGDVYDSWVAGDPALAEAIDRQELIELFDRIEDELHIRPTDEAIAGPNNLLLRDGAEALGLEHRPIRRNVRGCKGLGRCLQGCPEGNKLSMDRSYLPDACEHGAEIYCNTRIDRVRLADRNGRATGVEGRAASGVKVRIDARRVVLAASAIQTPLLLIRSGLRRGPVGRGFQCHPGASVTGRFAEPVRMWTGATQGHEVIGLRREGIKFEALGYDMSMVATRVKGVGPALARGIEDMAHQCHWGAAIKASARGRVRSLFGRPLIEYSLERDDLARIRRGVRVLGEMMLAAGAQYVEPGVPGWHSRVSDRAVMARFEDEGPRDPTAYSMAATHMFGTCRMGTNPTRCVVGTDFQHHDAADLFVADSSVFPSNTGVNPQTSIIALATLCGRSVVA